MKRPLLLAILVGLMVAAAIGGYYWYSRETYFNYVIPGVPDYTFFSVGYNLGKNAPDQYFQLSPTKAALDTVFDYWGGQRGVLQKYPDGIDKEAEGRTFFLADLADFARSQGYDAEVLRARDISDLHAFINPQVRTPVLVYQPPALNYHGLWMPYRVIIGLRDRDRKVIVHDFTFGNNYEISYDNFTALWGKSASGLQGKSYLVIRPKNWQEVSRKLVVASRYPERAPVMDQTILLERMLYLNDRLMHGAKPEEMAVLYGDIIKEDKALQYFPRWVLTTLFANAAAYNYRAGNIADAVSLARKADDLNRDLGEPKAGWTYSWPYGDELARVWLNDGVIYENAGDRTSAIANYQRAWQLKNQLTDDSQKRLAKRLLNLGVAVP